MTADVASPTLRSRAALDPNAAVTDGRGGTYEPKLARGNHCRMAYLGLALLGAVALVLSVYRCGAWSAQCGVDLCAVPQQQMALPVPMKAPGSLLTDSIRSESRTSHRILPPRTADSGASQLSISVRAESGAVSDREAAHLQQDGDLAVTKYKSYDEYVAHQKSKLNAKFHKIKTIDAVQRQGYSVYFRKLGCFDKSSVLCLGARLGGEVAAFDDAGALAIGIDLNPGPENKYVLTGDFHNLQFGDGRFDFVFMNVLDHAFDLMALRREICRVLRPSGRFVVDWLPGGNDNKKQAQTWESINDSDMDKVFHKMAMKEVNRLTWDLTHPSGATTHRVTAFLTCL